MQFSLKSKCAIRRKALVFRENINKSEKEILDSKIIKNLISLEEFAKSDVLCVYVSKQNEIDTKVLIEEAIKLGKKVAVPKCISKTDMEFYYIDSLSQLENGNFGVLEPNSNLQKATCFNNAFVVVPSLAVDVFGFRVGYGKGYYDRFLSTNSVVTAVLCYYNQLYFKIMHSKYDYRCKYVVTEQKAFKRKGINNG